MEILAARHGVPLIMRLSRIFLLAAAAFALAAGDPKQGGTQQSIRSGFRNTEVTGLEYARDFSLKDHTGKLRTLADFKGKAVVLFFGYTHCPDICPTTMTELANVMKQLGPLAERVQVLFVTVDPERDSAEFLSKYVPAFDPRFLGLVGEEAATDAIAKEFRLYYQKVPGKEPGSYSVDHGTGTYVFDPKGRIRLLVRHGMGAESIAHDLRMLLD